jgi:exodeoxyribonuclease VII small subunit
MAVVKKDGGDDAPAEKFEDSLDELETIVSQLESGAKPLEESLALYEKGIAALRKCHGILDKAEKRIKLLVKGANGEPIVGDADGFGDEEIEGQKSKVKSQRTTKDADLTEEERGQKTAGLAIDSEGVSGQNRAPSTSTKPGTKGGSKAGGSLFGSAQ